MSMVTDSYISDRELENVRKRYGKKIILFADTLKEVNEWYDYFKTTCPSSCINNYRDSWFHYRKLWKERSSQEVISQMANLDEHLQRAEKDAVVGFFQDISWKMEYWYLAENHIIPTKLQEQIARGVDSIVSSGFDSTKDKTMTFKIWRTYMAADFGSWVKEQEASFALIYYARMYVLSESGMRSLLQKMLHEMKNATLEIRLEASNIDRINEPGEYVNRYGAIYKELKEFCNKEQNSEISALLGLTEIVAMCVSKYIKDTRGCLIEKV